MVNHSLKTLDKHVKMNPPKSSVSMYKAYSPVNIEQLDKRFHWPNTQIPGSPSHSAKSIYPMPNTAPEQTLSLWRDINFKAALAVFSSFFYSPLQNTFSGVFFILNAIKLMFNIRDIYLIFTHSLNEHIYLLARKYILIPSLRCIPTEIFLE